MTTTVDKFGRVVIPKRLRSRLGMDAGSQVTIEAQGDALVLRAAHLAGMAGDADSD